MNTSGFSENERVRLTFEHSLVAFRERGFEVPASLDLIPKAMPAFDGDCERVSFFRTRLENETFRDLSLPWTLFLRSEISGCDFANCDLTQSAMTWCDWINCHFTEADLRGCDLRRSNFQDCLFGRASMDEADLRGAHFVNCGFDGASMRGSKIEKGFFLRPRSRQLSLSQKQIDEVAWSRSFGDEPAGG